MTKLVDIIRELREDNGLKQKDVAEFLGTTQQMYSRYERGWHEIPVRYVDKLCVFYNISADYVFCYTDEPKPCPAVEQEGREVGRIKRRKENKGDKNDVLL